MQEKAYDLRFGQAVKKVAKTLVPKRKNGEYTDGDDLANILRSTNSLGEGERELLALLVTGELQSKRGAAPSKGVGLGYVQETVAHFRQCRAKGSHEKVAIDDARMFLKTKFGFEKNASTIRKWISETIRREQLLQKSQDKSLPK